MSSDIKYWLFILLIFGLGALLSQSLLVPLMEIHVWKPDLVLIIVLLIGKRFRSMYGSSSGFILGVLQDALTGMPIGITALPKALAGYAAGKTKTFHFEGTLYYVWFVFLILLHEMISYAFFQYKTDLSYAFLLYSRIFPNTIYSVVMLFIIHSFTRKYFTE